MYLVNSFSAQMILTAILNGGLSVYFESVPESEVQELLKAGKLISAIGHKDTANLLGLDWKEEDRKNLSLRRTDVIYLAQYCGGRLPEGATTLPQGAKFEFVKITVE